MAWEYCARLKPLLNQLKKSGIRIVGLENNLPLPLLVKAGSKQQQLTTLENFHPKFPLALLLGNEVEGIRREYLALCDDIVEIPMQGQKESLNVAVAAGIAMYAINTPERIRKRKLRNGD